jgi:hypothetical protein
MKWIHDRIAGKVCKHSLSPWPNVAVTLGARLNDCCRANEVIIIHVSTTNPVSTVQYGTKERNVIYAPGPMYFSGPVLGFRDPGTCVDKRALGGDIKQGAVCVYCKHCQNVSGERKGWRSVTYSSHVL